jgi:CheY-like chemotaxis protein
MDVMIPDISGLELMRALAAGEDTRDIPVIVITGGDSDASMWRLFRQERNFADFIAKTAPLDLIVERVQELAAKE